MIYYYLSNPFLSRLSNENFGKLSSTHIERLTANTPVTDTTLYGVPVTTIFDTMKTGTLALYTDWKSSVDLNETQKSQKEGKTISVNAAIKDVKDVISSKEGVIADKYHRGSAFFEEFFPHGLNEYSSATKKNADILFPRFITALNTHKADFDESMLSEVNDKYNIYLHSRKTQLQSISKVKDESITSNDKRRALAMQLYRNLLTLLLIYSEEPEKAAVYFDESILKRKSPADKPPEGGAQA